MAKVSPNPRWDTKGPAAWQALQNSISWPFAEVGDVFEHGDETVEQAQAVLANRLVLVHDHNAVEERVDGSAQISELGQSGGVIVAGEMLCNLAFGGGNRVEQRTFFVAKQRLVNVRAQLLVAQVVRAAYAVAKSSNVSACCSRAATSARTRCMNTTGSSTLTASTASMASEEAPSSFAMTFVRVMKKSTTSARTAAASNSMP